MDGMIFLYIVAALLTVAVFCMVIQLADDLFDINIKKWWREKNKKTLPPVVKDNHIDEKYLVECLSGQTCKVWVVEKSKTGEYIKIWRYDPGYHNKVPTCDIWVQWIAKDQFEKDYRVIERMDE